MNSKRYKIVIANTGQISDMQSEAENTLNVGGFAKLIPQFRDAIEQFKNLDPKQFQKKLDEIVNYLSETEKSQRQIQVKLDEDTQDAALYIQNFMDTYGFSKPDAVELLNAIFDASSKIQLAKDEGIEYAKIYLEIKKIRNPKVVAQNVSSDFQSIKELSDKVNLPPYEVFSIFESAVLNNDFSPIYAMVAIVPLLKIDLLSKDTSKIESMMAETIPIVQNLEGIKKPLSNEGLLLEELVKSANAVKIAFDPILELIIKATVSRQISFDKITEKDFKNNPETYSSLYLFHNNVDQDFNELKKRFDNVGRGTIFAPTTPINVGEAPGRTSGAKVNKKFRIIVSQNQQTAQPAEQNLEMSEISNAKSFLSKEDPESVRKYDENYRKISSNIESINNLLTFTDVLKKEIDEFLQKPESFSESQEGLIQIFTSYLDVNSVYDVYQKLMSNYNKINIKIKDTKSRIDAILSNGIYPPVMTDPVETQKEKIDVQEQQINIQIKQSQKKYEMIFVIVPYLQMYEDKMVDYQSFKAQLQPASSRFFVSFNEKVPVYDVNSGRFLGYQNTQVDLPRLEFVNKVVAIGDEIVYLMNVMSHLYSQIPSVNARRTSVRIQRSAEKFSANNQEFADKEFGIQAPTAAEPRK